MPINPKTKALHDAVSAYCEKRGVNAQTIAVITEKVVGLISSRWEHICDSAHDEENGGKIAISVPIKLDLNAKCPVGVIGLQFTPSKVKDVTEFNVGDPDQGSLPLDGGAEPPTRPRRTRRPRATVTEAEPATA